ncbi:uncharacterized protein LOC116878370 [Lontra canadensis]|uniref:uncharacterized protein LOC116878370 n=1 Tax=Lontra canadensis TaxID=76717 RepID=UPI0013F2D36A|nr:uncharacterized protein LOC116878370 [Lontra canadensis]
MAPEADAIGETAQSGGAPAAAVCWLGAGNDGGAGSSELYDGASSRLPNPRRLPLCGRATGPPAGSAALGLTTDSTSHQPPRPRALRSSAPHVTASACLRARPVAMSLLRSSRPRELPCAAPAAAPARSGPRDPSELELSREGACTEGGAKLGGTDAGNILGRIPIQRLLLPEFNPMMQKQMRKHPSFRKQTRRWGNLTSWK